MIINEDIFQVTPSGYQLILLDAWRRGLNVNIGKNGKYIIDDGVTSKQFQWTGLIGDDILLSRRIARNKRVTKKFIALELGLQNNVPRWKSYHDVPDNKVVANDVKGIGFPLVVKKVNGSKGDGVYPGLNNKEELFGALGLLKESKDKEILLEEHVFGKDCRIFVVGAECVSVTHRTQAAVQGDGKSAISVLIERRNAALRKTGSGLVQVDKELLDCVAGQGYELTSIPKRHEVVLLSKKNNTSRGGSAIDISDHCPEKVKKLAVDVVKGLPNVSHAGVDIIIPDDAKRSPVVLEINLAAEIGLQRFRKYGKLIPEKIVSCYFPKSKKVSSKANWYFDWQQLQKRKERYAPVPAMPNDKNFIWLDIDVEADRVPLNDKEIASWGAESDVHGSMGFNSNGRFVLHLSGTKRKLSGFLAKVSHLLGKKDRFLVANAVVGKPRDFLVGVRVEEY